MDRGCELDSSLPRVQKEQNTMVCEGPFPKNPQIEKSESLKTYHAHEMHVHEVHTQ
jgi:hypothetical protein